MRSRRIVVWAVMSIVSSGLAMAQIEWVEDPEGPVIEPAGIGPWDYRRNPLAVVRVDGTYHLYFNGNYGCCVYPNHYDIGHATSEDGVSWQLDEANPVLTRGVNGSWDDRSLWGVGLIHDETGFKMWYAGGNGEIFRVGYATSADGSVWHKYPANPVMDVGPPGAFDSGGVVPGTVMVEDGTYRMWYAGSGMIGYAESADGLNWTRRADPVFEPGLCCGSTVLSPSVVWDGSRYRMWYGGVWRLWGQIGTASSPDGIRWVGHWDNPIYEHSGGTKTVSPKVLFNSERSRFEMWYGLYSWFAGFTDVGVFRATSDCCTDTFATVIPAAAYAAGAEGSFYETDLDISNPSAVAIEYRFAWLPRGESNEEPVTSGLYTLGAGKSSRFSNVLAEVFGLEPDSFGALRIESSSSGLLAMARIANIEQDGSGGSFGQSMVAIRTGDFSSVDDRGRLLFGTENADMRFNVGCQTTSSEPVRVRFELFAADGTLLSEPRLDLMPWGNDQLNRIFEGFRPMTGYVDYWSELPGSNVYCYGSLLDNVTSDPTTIPPM